MPKTVAERNRDKEARKKAAGLREIRVWVPDRDKYGPEPEQRVREKAAEEVAKVKEEGE